MQSVSTATSGIKLHHGPLFDEKMTAEGLDPIVRETFHYYYDQIHQGDSGLIYNHEIEPVSPQEVVDSCELAPYTTIGAQNLTKTVRIILNGGLGTSMGLDQPKSLLTAREKVTFLELILKQARHDGNRLVLMNSFHTQSATQKALKNAGVDEQVLTFQQNKFPKILQASLKPAHYPKNRAMEWNPPGHGDIFTALYSSGALDGLIQQGVRYAYISNCDNLGAYIDLGILGYFGRQQLPFLMEVSRKTPADIKGGHLAKRLDGRLILRESVQCPKEEMRAFTDINTFRYFNTNSIWVNLAALKTILSNHGFFKLPLIRNPKALNPLDAGSPAVFQVETAMGAAISLFKGARAVEISRDRFFPVKKCNELLAIRSDRFQLSPRYTLQFHPQALPHHLPVDLDHKHYALINDFEMRFSQGIPSLRNCRSLSIKGDVYFGKGVVLEGNVRITNNTGDAVKIEDSTIIEGAVSF